MELSWPVVASSIAFMFFGGLAVLELFSQFRYPNRYRVIIDASDNSLDHISPGVFWGISRRRYQRDEIRAVELRPLKPLWGKKTVAELRLRIKGGLLPIRLRLTHPDTDFPDRVAAAFRRVLPLPPA